jgi:hypothetical protein
LSDIARVPDKNENLAALQSWINTVCVFLGVYLAPDKAETPLRGITKEKKKNMTKQLHMIIPTLRGSEISQEVHAFVNKVKMYL